MHCPFCGSSQVMVVNSRPNKSGGQIWRRRKCQKCHQAFTTYEKLNLSYLVVVKKSGKRVKYQRAKLFASIYHSSLDKKHADRGDIGEFAEYLTDLVEKEILKSQRQAVHSSEITEIVLSFLKQKAPDTFLRYLAYREGENMAVMRQYLKGI
jgi:transcriptional repressor NrdR